MTTTDPFTTPVSDPFMQQQSGNPALKFPNVGDYHVGVITEVKERNDTKPDGTLKTWPNGDAMKVFVMTLDDNGDLGDLWVRGHMVTVIREAAKEAGLTTVIGQKLTIQHTGMGEAKKGQNAPKLFKAKLEPAPAAAARDTASPF